MSPRLEATLAYRYNDVKTTINGDLRRTPLTSRYKGLVNLSYLNEFEEMAVRFHNPVQRFRTFAGAGWDCR